MSILTRLLVLSKRYSARTFASWVFPTPVGPRKKNEPIGLLGSFKSGPVPLYGPDYLLDRIILPDYPVFQFIAHIEQPYSFGLSNPLYRNTCHHCNHFCHLIIIHHLPVFGQFLFPFLLLMIQQVQQFLFLVALTGCKLKILVLNGLDLFLPCIIYGRFQLQDALGTTIFEMCTRDPDSSSASIALSGRCRSEIYLLVRVTHAWMASEYNIHCGDLRIFPLCCSGFQCSPQ
jgi:hypothetical protein